VLRAAGEPTRLRLLAVLAQGELTVTELTQILGQSQPRISRHLKLLVDAGLLERKPEGSWVFFRMASETGGAQHQAPRWGAIIAGLVPRNDPSLARDLDRLEAVRGARNAAATAYFKANARRWDEIRALHVSERAVEAAILDLLGEGPFNHCVDLGTGTGRMLQLVAPHVLRGEGIDLNHEMLALARASLDRPELRHCQVRHGDIFSLPFPNGAPTKANAGSGIDLVLLHQVLHYLADPAAAIAEAVRILAPGGKLLIVDFSPHGIEQLRDGHAHRRLGFSDEEVSSYLSAAGLRVDEVRHLEPDAHHERKERLTVTLWRAFAPGGGAASQFTGRSAPGQIPKLVKAAS
jgi:ubiquinone/menaquinone biosynthesis C-methylase UbiE